jgi:phosphohistidine phosphatase
MATNELRPSLVLVSSALRARQTFEYFEDAVQGAIVKFEPAVYGADVDDLVELLRALPAEHASVLLVGHNPTIQDLALTLATRGPGLEAARSKFPTAALAVLDADIDAWPDLGPDTSSITDFVTPKRLEP